MMPLISLADGLAHARQHRYALGAFNVLDSHFLRALFAAAKQERSPFIINIAEVHFKYVSLDSLVEAVKFEAARHAIPVVLNLDHGLHYDAVVRALRLGFSSVMFDGSTLSYEENVRQMREVVKMCHAVGVSVEAELGAVGGDEGGALYGHADEAFFTDPQLAREFVDSTGIDALAAFIKEIGLPTSFAELGIPADTDFRAVTDSTNITAGCCKKLTHDEIYEILQECL